MDDSRALYLYAVLALSFYAACAVSSFSELGEEGEESEVEAAAGAAAALAAGAGAEPETLLEGELSRAAGARATCAEGALCTQMRNCRLFTDFLDPTCLATNRLHDLVCGYIGSEPLMCCPAGYVSNLQGSRPTPTYHAPERPAVVASVPTAFSPGCGHRLVRGAESGLGTQPWAVRVGFKHVRSSKLTYPCCGSIVTPRTILTAAHCAVAKSQYYKLSSVVAGEYDSRGDPDCTRNYCALPAQTVPISHVVVHPGYERSIFKHDIALLILKSPLNYSLTVQPACISESLQNEVQRTDKRALLVGWGKLPGQEAASPRQQQLELPLQPLERCAELYRNVLPITGRQLCAGGEEGRDACSGFGGAPLVLRGYDSLYYQIGMASFGSDKCGERKVPSVYTNVGKYASWIKSNAEQ